MNTETITAALRSAIPALTRAAGIPVTFSLPPATVGAKFSIKWGAETTAEQVRDATARLRVALVDEGFFAEERSVLRKAGDHTCYHVRAWYPRRAA